MFLHVFRSLHTHLLVGCQALLRLRQLVTGRALVEVLFVLLGGHLGGCGGGINGRWTGSR